MVALAGMAVDGYAEGAQLLDPAPHRIFRDADFFGDFCAADYDRGIFGEQRE